jgi:ribosome-associated protein
MDSKTLAHLCRDYADNKKAENITVLDVRKVSTVTDYFVIATGSSEPHLRAITDAIVDGLLADHRVKPFAVDGTPRDTWRVMDYFDVIVHVMRKETRELYDLEGLWGDAAVVKTPAAKKAAAKRGGKRAPRRATGRPAKSAAAAKPARFKTSVRKLPARKK